VTKRAEVCVASAASIVSPAEPLRTAPEMVFDVARRAVDESGLERSEIDLIVSGSSDVLDGRSFGFAYALEALGLKEPTLESHLEMDGAWAAYYAWLKLLAGEAETALVVAWGKASEAPLARVMNAQLDPFCLAPLELDRVVTAALQADAWMERSGASVDDLDAVVRRAEAARAFPRPTDKPISSPLHLRHCPLPADGACAVVLAVDARAPSHGRPVFIAGADHRSESGALGARDLSALPSASRAAARAREIAGWDTLGALDVVELSAPFAHQELMLLEALGAADARRVNPSGGALAADPMMATGLIRLAECAARVERRGLAHASAGHALQQNLVFLLEAAQ
jgi:acetyl-CoA acetyltransferase